MCGVVWCRVVCRVVLSRVSCVLSYMAPCVVVSCRVCVVMIGDGVAIGMLTLVSILIICMLVVVLCVLGRPV